MLALAAARVLRTRVFIRGETHLLLPIGRAKRLLRKPLMTLFYRLCDASLYIGSRNPAFYRAHGVADRELFFVPYTGDDDFFTARAERSRREGEGVGRGVDLPA